MPIEENFIHKIQTEETERINLNKTQKINKEGTNSEKQAPVNHVVIREVGHVDTQVNDLTHSSSVIVKPKGGRQASHVNHVETQVNEVTHSGPFINSCRPTAGNGEDKNSWAVDKARGGSQVNQGEGYDITHSQGEANVSLPLSDSPVSPNTTQDVRDTEIEINGNSVPKSGLTNLNEDKNTLNILNWNTGGFLDKINLDGFCDFINSFDIIGLGETFTNINFDFSIKFKEFEAFHSPAEHFSHLGRPSGGLVLLVKKTLKEVIEIVDSGISHILSLKIKKEYLNTTKDVLYINTYVHPAGSIFYSNKDYQNTLDEIEQFILDQTEGRNDLDIILGGDLNARVGDWSYQDEVDIDEEEDADVKTYDRNTQDQVINNNGKRLIEICTMFGLTPLGGLKERSFDSGYTFIGHRGSSHIDHFAVSTNLVNNITNFKIIDRIESNHLPITMSLNCNGEDTTSQQQEMKISKIKWQEEKVEECKEVLMNEKTQKDLKRAEQIMETDINGSLQLFNKIMKKANNPMRKSFMIKNGGTPPKKWFDKECRKKKTETKKQLGKLNRINALNKPNEYQQEKKKYLDKKVEYHQLVRDKRKEFNCQTKKQILDDIKDSKKFWRRIKMLSANRPKLPNIPIQTWEEHFNKVHNPEELNDETNVNLTEEIFGPEEVRDEELDAEITQEEIKQSINKLKAGKAAGLDEIGPELIKLAEPRVSAYLHKLFNKIYNTGNFPIEWAKAIIVPLLKKGEVTNCDNYRGISLLSIISKLFAAILNRRLYRWAEENNKISDEQAGFRRSYSTTDHIFTLHTMVNSCLFGNRRSKLYVAFIDYRKAFDTVKRDTLWQILKDQNVPTKILKILINMYKGVKVIVRFGNNLSNEINCPLGVRQGCLLSPLLFSLLITEVAKKIAAGGRAGYQLIPGARDIFSLLFADDIVLIARTPAGLQNQINNLKEASANLGLVVNLDKTKVMVFRKGGYLGRAEKWYYGREKIEVVNSYKYLGFTFTTKLSTDIALAEFAGRAKKKIVIIFKTLYKLGQIDVKTFFQLFDVQVKPMLLYAAEIWGATKYEVIEKTHMFACKKLLGVSARTPNTFIYAELNRYPLFIDSQIRVLKYWQKLLLLDEDRIPKQAYEKVRRDLNNINGWGYKLKKMLDLGGFSNVWLQQGTTCMNSFIKEFKLRLIDMNWQDWHAKLTEKDRFSTYRLFKEEHNREDYLKLITITKFRRVFTRTRLGIIDINENKKFRDPLADRKCPFCSVNETELHLILVCPSYDQLRIKYIIKHWNQGNNLTLKNLLACTQQEKVQDLAMFLFYALKRREHLM